MDSTNQKARDVIKHVVKREESCKLSLLSDLFGKINEICNQKHLDYFAIGRLLNFCLTSEDTYPDVYRYDIGLIRKDYEAFLTAFGKKSKDEISLRNSFNPEGFILRPTAYLVKRQVFHFDNDTLDMEVRIYLHPYDTLPADKKERNRFLAEASMRSGRLRRLSLTSQKVRKKAGGRKDQLKRLITLAKDGGLGKSALLKKKKAYQSFLTQYADRQDASHICRIEHVQYAPVKKEDIFPLKDSFIEGTRIRIPAKGDNLAPLSKEEETARAVKNKLKALETFDRLCRDHGLCYLAMEDLAIACSHDSLEGMDEKAWMVGLMRRDYEQALGLLKDPSCPLRLMKTLPHYPSVQDDRVSFGLCPPNPRYPGEKTGRIYMVPFDAIPDDYETRLSFAKEVKELARLYSRTVQYETGSLYFLKTAGQSSASICKGLQEKRQEYNRQDQTSELIFYVTGSQMITLPANEIFPPSKGSLAGRTIPCPANPFIWFVKKDPAYTEYLAQRRTQVMKIFDQLTRDHGIDYFAMSNLLIGAVIYHDVMPESDQRNMDIALLRDDYEAFLTLMREKGRETGIELYEYLDDQGKYPLDVKYLTLPGQRYSQARIRILPFDKVPEDFYLYQGLRDEIDAKNEDYHQLLRLYDASLHTQAALPAAMSKEKKAELLKAVPAEEAKKIESLAQSFRDDDRTSSYMWITFGKSKIITRQELYPLQRVAFRDMEINCPRDGSVWQPVLDSELARQVSCIQKTDLFIMQEFDRVCKELGTGYFICGGTMLGYMRHGGFIPWDDDVDVAMLREDYDRFMKEAGPLLSDRFFLQTRESDPHIPYLFSKIRLDDTEYITKYNEKRDFHKGICLDIFPFDFVPEDEEERKKFVEEVRGLATAHHLIARRQFPIPEDTCEPRNEQEARYIREQKAILTGYWEKDLAQSQQAYTEAATRYNSRAKEEGLRTVASFVPDYTYIDLSDLLPYQRGRFEDIEVSVPKRPDIFLEMQYGDYMKLPPKHMQVAHRLLRWSTWEARGEASSAGQETEK